MTSSNTETEGQIDRHERWKNRPGQTKTEGKTDKGGRRDGQADFD